MKIDIGNKAKHHFNTDKVDLPKSNEAYHLIFESTEGGSLISAAIRFNTHEVLFKIEIDGEIFSEFDVEDLQDSFRHDEDNKPNHPIVYNDKAKMVEINFSNPLSYRLHIKFYAKSNDTKTSRDLKSYSIILGDS